MTIPLRILIVDDSKDDTMFLIHELHNRGFKPSFMRVDDESAMSAALESPEWELVVCDHRMPHFSSFEALKMIKDRGLDIPFIIVSGTISEDLAVTAMKAGASDFIMKDNLARLAPAIRRELQDAAERKARRQAERELAETRATLQTALEQMLEGVVVADPKGHLIYFNAAAQELLGGSVDSTLQPEDWSQRYGFLTLDGQPFPVAKQPLICALVGEVVTNVEMAIRKAQKKDILIAVSAKPIHDRSGALLGAVAVFRDITREQQIQKELVRQRKLAGDASHRKTRMLQALSHDIRTPLNSINLTTELLQRQDALPPRAFDRLGVIKTCVWTVLDLLRDLLDLAQLDAGLIELEVISFNPEAAVRELVESTRPVAAAKGLDLEIEEAEAAWPLQLKTDRVRFKQILNNLLSNAVTYTETGHITVRCRQRDGRPAFEVEDTGIGVPAPHQELIFEEFYLVDRPHRPMSEGKGLGLAIGRNLAKLLGGDLQFRERPGGGSIFSLVLPNQAVEKPVHGEIGNGHQKRNAKPLILVVDDQIDARMSLAQLLEMKGFATEEASNGKEALEHAQRRLPDLVLMDLMMPIMGGLEAIRIMRQDPKLRLVPVAVLTGDITHETRQAATNLEVAAFLEKPLDPSAFERLVHLTKTTAR
jgi:signal transduction histidine kinase